MTYCVGCGHPRSPTGPCRTCGGTQLPQGIPLVLPQGPVRPAKLILPPAAMGMSSGGQLTLSDVAWWACDSN